MRPTTCVSFSVPAQWQCTAPPSPHARRPQKRAGGRGRRSQAGARRRLWQRYGLIVLLVPSPFVDPLHMTLEEREKQESEETAAEEPEGGGGGGGDGGASAGGRRGSMALFRKAASGKQASKKMAKAAVAVLALGKGAAPPPQLGGAGKSQYVFEMVKQTVKNNFLFRHLEDDALLKVVHQLREVRCEAGRIVCREGEKGDYFYIVESGVYAVYQVRGRHPVHLILPSGMAIGCRRLIFAV